MRRIQEKRPLEKTIWDPVPVPIARFIAFEQMARSARRSSLFSLTLGRRSLGATKRELRNRPARASGAVSDTLVVD